jgi:DNA repair exonuclease SbcCD nuclease subunit
VKAFITGDWHIGLNTHGVFIPEYGMSSRLMDIKAAANEIIDAAINSGASHFLHLGDLFHTNHPTPTEIGVAQELIQRLSKAEITTYIISGNHDFVQGNKLDVMEMFGKQELANVKFFSDPKVVVDGDVRLVIVPHCTQLELMHFVENSEIPQDGKLNVMLCHTTFTGAQVGSEDRMMAAGVTMLRQELNVKVVFSGHIHKPQKLVSAYSGRADVYYPGSPVQMDFAERNDQKEFIVFENNGPSFHVTHQPIKAGRKLVQIETCDYNTWGNLDGAIIKVVVPKDQAVGWTIDDIETTLMHRGAFLVSSVKIIDNDAQQQVEQVATSQTDQNLMWEFLSQKLGDEAEAGWYEAQEVLADVKRTST